MMRRDRGKRSIRVRERPEEPPTAERDPGELRASAWCGGAQCPKVVLSADSAAALRQLEWRYACSRCGKPDPCAAAERRRWRGGGAPPG
jgi:hypothetical protein